jgi:2-amino-4-hydroxy-6-hydroxymethyldihydropteridine diphosphokinase
MTRDAPAECRALVALGSNLPWRSMKPSAILLAALEKLGAIGILEARSGWWSTPAWPDPSDPTFLNLCVRLRFGGAPAELLHALLGLERVFGRERGAPNAARTLDLDLIDFDGVVVDRPADGGLPRLALPHPHAHERAFVLLPLLDIAPEWRHPVLGATVGELIARLPPAARAGVRRVAFDEVR